MNDIESKLAPLYEEAEKLMKEIEEAKVPSSGIIQRFINKLNTYSYKAEVHINVYEGHHRHHVYLYYFADTTVLNLNDHNWTCLGYHDQLVLVHTLPKLMEEFLKAVRHNHLVMPESIQTRIGIWNRMKRIMGFR